MEFGSLVRTNEVPLKSVSSVRRLMTSSTRARPLPPPVSLTVPRISRMVSTTWFGRGEVMATEVGDVVSMKTVMLSLTVYPPRPSRER
jgi:hypothetical protein